MKIEDRECEPMHIAHHTTENKVNNNVLCAWWIQLEWTLYEIICANRHFVSCCGIVDGSNGIHFQSYDYF